MSTHALLWLLIALAVGTYHEEPIQLTPAIFTVDNRA